MNVMRLFWMPPSYDPDRADPNPPEPDLGNPVPPVADNDLPDFVPSFDPYTMPFPPFGV